MSLSHGRFTVIALARYPQKITFLLKRFLKMGHSLARSHKASAPGEGREAIIIANFKKILDLKTTQKVQYVVKWAHNVQKKCHPNIYAPNISKSRDILYAWFGSFSLGSKFLFFSCQNVPKRFQTHFKMLFVIDDKKITLHMEVLCENWPCETFKFDT